MFTRLATRLARSPFAKAGVVSGSSACLATSAMSLASVKETLNDGSAVAMGKYAGNVLYVVNVASA
jgi:hypothetical protein